MTTRNVPFRSIDAKSSVMESVERCLTYGMGQMHRIAIAPFEIPPQLAVRIVW